MEAKMNLPFNDEAQGTVTPHARQSRRRLQDQTKMTNVTDDSSKRNRGFVRPNDVDGKPARVPSCRQLHGSRICESADEPDSTVDLCSTVDQIGVCAVEGSPDIVYNVVQGMIPQDLRESLVQDFTENERHEIYHRAGVFKADCNHAKPKALWVFGPPAVGKTTFCNELGSHIFGWLDNAVTIDGADFRAAHQGFQRVAKHGLRNHVLHEDAWKLLKGTGHMDTLKEELLQLAIDKRQNLKIPETAMNIERVDGMLKKLLAAGYDVYAACLWAPKSQTEARGRARGVREGKAFTTKPFEKASRNAVALGQIWLDRMAAGESQYKAPLFVDNTRAPGRCVQFFEFENLTNFTDDMADEHVHTCIHES